MTDRKPQSIDSVSLERDIVKKFRCPVCDSYMFPPIGQCTKGHTYCSKCFKIMSQCVECSAGKSKARCSVLESLSSILRFPCSYAEEGCKFTGNPNVMSHHAQSCKYSTAPCPIGKTRCSWVGRESERIPHLSKMHPEQFSTTCREKFIWKRNMKQDEMQSHIFSIYDQLFRFSWIMDNRGDLRFSLFRLGKWIGHPHWSYQVTITHPAKPGALISYTNPVCFVADDEHEEENCCLWLNLDRWSWRGFCGDELNLHYSINISEYRF